MSIGIIGCGYWGSKHAENLASLGLLSAVADKDSWKAKIISDKFNIPTLDVEELIHYKDIKGIVIASNTDTHYELAIKAIEAQKHLLVEKPIALTSDKAQILYDNASKNQLIFMVGHLLNFHPAYHCIKKLIKEIGQVYTIKSRRLNIGQIRQKENVLWSFAPHDISLILGLTSSLDLTDPIPKHIWSYGKKMVSTIEDEYFVSFVLPNDITVEINVSWCHPYKEHKLFVIGEKGSIVFDDSLAWENKVTLYRHQLSPTLTKGEMIAIPIDEKYPLKEELLYFHNCIVKQQLPIISTGKEGVTVIKIIEQIEAHAKL